jgi:hypothetical protein
MKSHRHILSKRAEKLNRERIKGQGHLLPKEETKVTSFAPTLLKNSTDKARRRVLRAASRIASWFKK